MCDRVKMVVGDSISIVKESFDNDLTPYYALAISIWGLSLSVCLSMMLSKRHCLQLRRHVTDVTASTQ